MEEVGGWCLGIVIAAAIIFYAIAFTLAAIYWLLASASFLMFATLDALFSSLIIPRNPEIMWGVWGAVIGGVLAFWTIAPIYGLRKFRPLIALSPFIVMVVVVAVRCSL